MTAPAHRRALRRLCRRENVGHFVERVALSLLVNVRVVAGNFCRVVADDITGNEFRHTGIFQQGRGGVSQAMKGDLASLARSVSSNAFRLILSESLLREISGN